MCVGMARDAISPKTQKGPVEVLHQNRGPRRRRNLRVIVALAALQRSVTALQLVARLSMIKLRLARHRPANQFKIGSDVFGMTCGAGCVDTGAVDGTRMVALAGTDAVHDLGVARRAFQLLPSNPKRVAIPALQHTFEIRVTS
jgi:hypothetical protein